MPPLFKHTKTTYNNSYLNIPTIMQLSQWIEHADSWYQGLAKKPVGNIPNQIRQLINSHGWSVEDDAAERWSELVNDADAFFAAENMPASWKQVRTWAMALDGISSLVEACPEVAESLGEAKEDFVNACEHWKKHYTREYKKKLDAAKQANPNVNEIDTRGSVVSSEDTASEKSSEGAECSIRDMGVHMLQTYIEVETDPLKKLYLGHVLTLLNSH